MARKRPNPRDVPPAASSSEEEEEETVDDQDKEDDLPNAQHDESESEEEGDEDEDEDEDGDGDGDEDDEEEGEKKNQSLQRPSQPNAMTKSPNQQEDEDEDESEAESDSDSKSADFSIRPHSSDSAITSAKDSASVKLKKPTGNPSKEKENAKAKESQSSVSVKLKRPAEGDIQINSKMKKVKSENGEQGVVAEKKPAFSRLWSEEDEIAVLKGMIEFHGKKGVDPNSDSTAFHEFVKKNISVDVSKSQLMEKVKRLKAKYKNNIEKGDNPVFSKPHEIKVFELSKRIWGGLGNLSRGGLGNTSNKKASKEKNLVVENAKPEIVMALAKAVTFQAVKNKENKLNQQKERKVEEGKFSDLYPFLKMSLKMNNFLMSKYVAEGMESCLVSLEKSKLEELEKEWKKQILDEAQVKLGRSALLQKQVQLVSEWCSKRG